jgi:hypothetical protein
MDLTILGQFFVDPSLRLEDFKQSLFYFNFEGQEQRNIDFLSHIDTLVNRPEPVILFTGIGKISFPTDLIDKIVSDHTNKNISVYLFETLSLYVNSNKEKFYGEIPAYCDVKNLRAVELDSLQDISDKLKCNFNVFVGEYGIDVLKVNYPNLHLETFDIFLRWLKLDQNVIGEKIIRKKFFCGNWRYSLHRNLIMSYLCDMDGNFTWYYNTGMKVLKKHPCFNFESLEKAVYKKLREGIDRINSQDLSLGSCYDKVNVENFYYSYYPKIKKGKEINSRDLLADYINESFCMVVTESLFFQPLANVSEKTFQAIIFQKPFVVAAPPKTLEYLRELGFRTFDRWWDESYDQESDHQKRMLKIFSVIDYVNSLDIETLKNIYLDMREVLQHNKTTLLELYNHESDKINR